MIVIGLMCVKDDADLLPQVLPHVKERVDYLYAYDDGSTDGSGEMLKEYADYFISLADDTARIDHHRGNYHHLLEKIKEDFKGQDDVWIVLTMGDRFYPQKSPRQIVEETAAAGYDSVQGVQLDFLRHRVDPWTEENDPFPDMSDIRQICRWYRFDERCVVAYKLVEGLSYRKAKYPWPRGLNADKLRFAKQTLGGKLSVDMPFLEHQGRRSPKFCVWRYGESGSRYVSRKYDPENYVSFEKVITRQRQHYHFNELLPWTDGSNLQQMVDIYNRENGDWENKLHRKYFYRGQQEMAKLFPLPPREDV